MRCSKPICPLILAAFFSLVLSSATAAATTWQLLFSYDSQSVTLLQADHIAPMTKQARTPGLAGAPIRAAYRLDWLDASRKSLHGSLAEIPLGIRAVLGDGEPCRDFLPDSGLVLVRVEGPDEKQLPSALRLTLTGVSGRAKDRLELPAPFRADVLEMPITQPLQSGFLLDGPISSEKIRDTGHDRNRLVIAIMGDGYTLANLTSGDFVNHTANLLGSFGLKAPWDVLFDATNIYRIDIESNQQGADHETYGVYKDTYLNSSFWTNNIERLLTLDGTGYSRAYAAANSAIGAGVWDYILVLVNSTKYGGSGGSIAVSSVHSLASEIVLHEMGHSFAGLADEYESPYPGYPPGDSEPNVDYDYSGPYLKWIKWVEPGTPLPTPEDSTYDNVVGAFEGARYLSTGIYRPWYNCLMRSLGVDFGPVCKEAHTLSFMYRVSLADNVSPAPSTSQEIDSQGKTFAISPLPISGLVYEWRIDGTPVPGATGPELTLIPEDLSQPTQTLKVAVTLATDLVRQDSVLKTYSWTVSPVEYCCVGSVGNVDCLGVVDIGDVSELIRHLFIDLEPLCCPEEANIDGVGIIDIGDLTALIRHLFISLDPTIPCP